VKTTIVVPCYDEAENVPRLVAELAPVAASLGDAELLIVDDGSRDGTADLIEARRDWPVPVRVVRHGRNRGLGAALRTGFAQARGERIVVTDADGTFEFATIPVLLDRLGDGVAIVIGGQCHPLGRFEGVPAWRTFLSHGASTLYRAMVDRRIYSWTGAYRAYRADVARETPFDSDGFMAMTEVLVNAVRAGHRVAEVPAVLRVRQFGQSKARPFRMIGAHLVLMSRLMRTPAPRPVSSRRAADEPPLPETAAARC
jgi:dolichol-phosphate mannosyltransferase